MFTVGTASTRWICGQIIRVNLKWVGHLAGRDDSLWTKTVTIAPGADWQRETNGSGSQETMVKSAYK